MDLDLLYSMDYLTCCITWYVQHGYHFLSSCVAEVAIGTASKAVAMNCFPHSLPPCHSGSVSKPRILVTASEFERQGALPHLQLRGLIGFLLGCNTPDEFSGERQAGKRRRSLLALDPRVLKLAARLNGLIELPLLITLDIVTCLPGHC